VSARDHILARVRAAVGHAVPAPAAFVPGARRADFAAFAELLVAAGGEAHGPVGADSLGTRVADLCRAWSSGARVVATDAALARLGTGAWQAVSADADPHTLADVSVAILCGAFGVAENGAVGLDGREARPRALPVLCERLILLLDVRSILPDMHAALARLPDGALAQHHFTFVAGPSKTADIEGALVLGAHGPRELAVFGVDGQAESVADPYHHVALRVQGRAW
jgi:L-lactate dehydrogenase complex protein LldG